MQNYNKGEFVPEQFRICVCDKKESAELSEEFTWPDYQPEINKLLKIDGVQNDLLPVRSNQPLPKEKLFDCMDVIRATTVKLPVNRYDVIVPNICGTGVDIVATKTVG